MAASSTIRDLWVINDPGPATDWTEAEALLFDGVAAKAERLNVTAGRSDLNTVRAEGVCVSHSTGIAYLRDVDVEARTAAGHSNALYLRDGASAVVVGSRLVGINSGVDDGTVDVIDIDGGVNGSLTIDRSRVIAQSPGSPSGVSAYHLATAISNSSIEFSSAGRAFEAWTAFQMTNCTVSGSAVEYAASPATKVANSQLPGNRAGLATARLVNDYDENLTPIPNQ